MDRYVLNQYVLNQYDVIVIGAGPTGLTAAGDLARAGRSVLVLDRRPTVNPSSRAFATMPRTLELLDARGLADGLLSKGQHATGVTIFAGARIQLSQLDTPYPYVLITPQTNVDAALHDYAVAMGADIHRGLAVSALEQDDDGVRVSAGDRQWQARYVIGADGAHSTVRALLGAQFPGKTLLSSIVLADIALGRTPDGNGLALGNTRDVFGFLAPYGHRDATGAWYRTMVWDRAHQVPDTEPVDDGEVADVLARAMGTDFGIREISWKSRFHCDERQVEHYRHGRVFLAGDAAHVHSPMGGQGMNTGIQDAVNLAWKIDAVLGGAPDHLLDTYQQERHPIGRRVLKQSGMMARAVTLRPRPARLLRNLLAPRLLRIPAFRDAVAGSFSGVTLRYPSGPGEHHLVGTRATRIPLTHSSVTEVQRAAGFLFIRERDAATITDLAIAQAERADDGPAVLVRPDGYLCWVGRSGDRNRWDAILRGYGASPAAQVSAAPGVHPGPPSPGS